MQEFVTLAKLPPTTPTHRLSALSQEFQRYQQALQQHNVRITNAWTTLGRYDVAFIIEAPDLQTAQVALVGAAQEWPIETETLACTPISTFIKALDTAMSTPASSRGASR